jgi:hypothetical protein
MKIFDNLVEGGVQLLVSLFALLVSLPMIIWGLNLSVGAIWWLITGEFGSLNFCAFFKAFGSGCPISTGLLGLDRILNWFAYANFLIVMPVISIFFIVVGIVLRFTLTSSQKS